VLVARVEEQLRVLGPVNELTGGVNIAFVDEERVGVHRVHLHRNSVGPGGAELRNRQAGMQEQRPSHPRSRLRELLGRHHTERKAGVHQLGG
jgi:hypothetical protein